MTAIIYFLRIAWPYILAASIGFCSAWKVQGYRITGLEQERISLQQKQIKLQQEAQAKADQQREQSAKDYAHVSDILSDEINRGVVYQRCVAAGRCGVRYVASSCPVPAVQADSGANAAIADSVPDRPDEGLANDCAKTTLMLNQLQSAIRGQDGY